MLKLSSTLINIPVFSLRTGHQFGIALKPLINPNNLKIEAWLAQSKFENGLLLLPALEIRELTRQGMAVNDHDAITPAEDLVRLQPVIRVNFQLIGKLVVTEKGNKIGKVEDYAMDTESFYINKLYVSPKSLSAFTKESTVVSRSQILEITDKKIVIVDLLATEKAFFKKTAQIPEY